jgi:hypothetical protein
MVDTHLNPIISLSLVLDWMGVYDCSGFIANAGSLMPLGELQ